MNSKDSHIFKRFDTEMDNLHRIVLQMGETAATQLQAAVATLKSEDPDAARKVIENDARLNQLDVEADDEIIHLIARRQPMAGDLRKLIAVGKIVSDLERAGDEARKIARLTIRFFKPGNKPPDEEILQDIFSLSGFVCELLDLSMQAFDTLDLIQASKVLEQGSTLDDKLQEILRRLGIFMVEDPGNIGHFIDIVLGIRALERFGGHAKNISGHIVFITDGIDVRHVDDEELLQNIRKKLANG